MVFWFLSTAFMMQKLIASLMKTPIIIYMDDIAVPVTEFYFPAVTFCPGLMIANDIERVFDYDNVKNSLENGEIDFSNLTSSE
jgi:hypothetical protein